MEKARQSDGLSFKGVKLQIYANLVVETLARRRLLKPLTEQI